MSVRHDDWLNQGTIPNDTQKDIPFHRITDVIIEHSYECKVSKYSLCVQQFTHPVLSTWVCFAWSRGRRRR